MAFTNKTNPFKYEVNQMDRIDTAEAKGANNNFASASDKLLAEALNNQRDGTRVPNPYSTNPRIVLGYLPSQGMEPPPYVGAPPPMSTSREAALSSGPKIQSRFQGSEAFSARIRENFGSLDNDENGAIDIAEIDDALKSGFYTDEEKVLQTLKSNSEALQQLTNDQWGEESGITLGDIDAFEREGTAALHMSVDRTTGAYDDLPTAFRKPQLLEQFAAKEFDKLDKNQDGCLDLYETAEAVWRCPNPEMSEIGRFLATNHYVASRFFDHRSGEATISKHDLYALIKVLDPTASNDPFTSKWGGSGAGNYYERERWSLRETLRNWR
jgi:Ca2+-binding EF-hand superfamily protein